MTIADRPGTGWIQWLALSCANSSHVCFNRLFTKLVQSYYIFPTLVLMCIISTKAFCQLKNRCCLLRASEMATRSLSVRVCLRWCFMVLNDPVSLLLPEGIQESDEGFSLVLACSQSRSSSLPWLYPHADSGLSKSQSPVRKGRNLYCFAAFPLTCRSNECIHKLNSTPSSFFHSP